MRRDYKRRGVHTRHPRVHGLEWKGQRRHGCGFFVVLLRPYGWSLVAHIGARGVVLKYRGRDERLKL
jgi:hypothetical protein